jgi:hypothetical protein
MCNVVSCWIYIGILLAHPVVHISRIRVKDGRYTFTFLSRRQAVKSWLALLCICEVRGCSQSALGNESHVTVRNNLLRLYGWNCVRNQFFRHISLCVPEVTFLTDVKWTSVICQAKSSHVRLRFSWTMVEFCFSYIGCVIFKI